MIIHTKKITVLLMTVLFAGALSAQSLNEEDAIKKVIEDETLSFANADLATWSNYFVHAPYIRWSVSPTMYFDGWDALYNGAKSFLEKKSGKTDADALHKINRSNWDIHINRNMASVKFVQVWGDDSKS